MYFGSPVQETAVMYELNPRLWFTTDSDIWNTNLVAYLGSGGQYKAEGKGGFFFFLI